MTKAVKPESFDHLLLYAQIYQESGFNSKAVSKAGAKGLMQIMDATFKEWSKKIGLKGADPFNPIHNIIIGTLELNRQIENFGKLDLALTAYNWGSGNLKKLIIDAKSNDLEVLKTHIPNSEFAKPMPKEAREYAQRIFNHYNDPGLMDRVDDHLKILN